MATTYTHDLFGKEVYRALSPELKSVLRKGKDLYRIGLQGPDIVFYYFCLSKNRVNQAGVAMHRENARGFFEQSIRRVREEKDPLLLAYILGFVNHYILDSCIHPVVNQIVGEEGPSHTVQEKELDRELMLRSGKDPFHTYPSDGIVPHVSYAMKIHKVLPEIPVPKLHTSLLMLKGVTNLMVRDDGGRREKLIGGFLRGIGQGDALGEFFMREHPPKGISVYLDRLEECYRQALWEAPAALEEVYRLAVTPELPLHLSDRFDRTYNG